MLWNCSNCDSHISKYNSSFLHNTFRKVSNFLKKPVSFIYFDSNLTSSFKMDEISYQQIFKSIWIQVSTWFPDDFFPFKTDLLLNPLLSVFYLFVNSYKAYLVHIQNTYKHHSIVLRNETSSHFSCLLGSIDFPRIHTTPTSKLIQTSKDEL